MFKEQKVPGGVCARRKVPQARDGETAPGWILEGSLGHTKELGFYSRCNAKALEAFKPENFQMLRGLLYCAEHGLEGAGVEGWVITRAAFALVRGERLFIEL